MGKWNDSYAASYKLKVISSGTVQHKDNSEFWNPTCVIGGNKKNY
jgi:hypothetical protein